MVLLTHFFPYKQPPNTWVHLGKTGVTIFFIISGYLISLILFRAKEHMQEGRLTLGEALRRFYIRRVLRIAPIYYASIAAAFVIGAPGARERIWWLVTYTSNFGQVFFDLDFKTAGHFWSLAVEEQFYLLWPLVIVVLGRTVKSPAGRTKVLLAGAAAIAVYRATRVGIYTDERINFGLDTRMDSLMTGAALACFVQSLPGGRLPDVAGKWLGRVVAPLMLAALFAVINTVTWYSPWMGWIGYALVAGAAALVVLDLVAGGHSWLGRLLAARPMVFGGRISYGLYLYHLPVYYAVENLMPAAPLTLRLAVKVTVSLLLAAASFHWIEQRFLKLKSRFEGKTSAASS